MTLSHDVAGNGPVVVLVHSTACDRRMWDPQVPALTDAGYLVVRCDLRGFGETPAPSSPYDSAQDLLDLLDLMAVETVSLVGASGGGRVALEAAARWPYRVRSLSLLCSAVAGHEAGPELRAFGEQEDALLAAGDIDGATDLNVRTWVGPDADDQTREKVRLMQRHAFEVQLAAPEVQPIRVECRTEAVTAPTLLLSGAHDLPDFGRIATGLAGRIPRARHVELPWAGHLPSLERPDEANRLLLDFLAETREPAAL